MEDTKGPGAEAPGDPSPAGATSAPVEWQPLPEFQQARANIFPTLEAIRWHLRDHREAYALAGALKSVNGRLLVVPGRFDAVLDRLGGDGLARIKARGRPAAGAADAQIGRAA